MSETTTSLTTEPVANAGEVSGPGMWDGDGSGGVVVVMMVMAVEGTYHEGLKQVLSLIEKERLESAWKKYGDHGNRLVLCIRHIRYLAITLENGTEDFQIELPEDVGTPTGLPRVHPMRLHVLKPISAHRPAMYTQSNINSCTFLSNNIVINSGE